MKIYFLSVLAKIQLFLYKEDRYIQISCLICFNCIFDLLTFNCLIMHREKVNSKCQIYISICSTVSFLSAIKKVRLLRLHPLLHLPRLDNGEWHLDVLKYKIQIQIYKKYKYANKYKITYKLLWYQIQNTISPTV